MNDNGNNNLLNSNPIPTSEETSFVDGGNATNNPMPTNDTVGMPSSTEPIQNTTTPIKSSNSKIVFIVIGIVVVLVILLLVFNMGDKNGQENNTNTANEKEILEREETREESKEQTKEDTSKNENKYLSFLSDGTTITDLTEEGKKQKSIVIPKQTKAFMGLSFEDSEVEEVSFEGDQDVEISYAFAHNSNIKKVTLPKNLSIIPDSSFSYSTGLESIVIPEGVTKIDEWAFNGCTSLKKVEFAGTNVKSIEKYAFDTTGLEEITLPEGLEKIASSAFRYNLNLKVVRLPSTIKQIDSLAFYKSGIEEIHFAAGVENVEFDYTAFFLDYMDSVTFYVVKGSWMDQNRDVWSHGYNIEYE